MKEKICYKYFPMKATIEYLIYQQQRTKERKERRKVFKTKFIYFQCFPHESTNRVSFMISRLKHEKCEFSIERMNSVQKEERKKTTIIDNNYTVNERKKERKKKVSSL